MTRLTSITLFALGALLAGGCSGETSSSAAPATQGAATKTIRITFEDQQVGQPPTQFTPDLTGGGGAPRWVVAEDATAPKGRKVLIQESAEKVDYRFPLCIDRDIEARDVDVSVRFKAVGGEVDRAAGIVARFQSRDGYYVVRANALEDNVRFYKVVSGARHQIAGADTRVTASEWHTLRLVLQGSRATVDFDGKRLFEASDSTFAQAGRIGLWTKADSVTEFDDLNVGVLDAP